MGELERQFAAYTATSRRSRQPHRRCAHCMRHIAHTYILKDPYLGVPAAGLANRDLGNLPSTQSAQRAAIGLAPPAGRQQAGCGVIAPQPGGS
jgi:hypothetical protein